MFGGIVDVCYWLFNDIHTEPRPNWKVGDIHNFFYVSVRGKNSVKDMSYYYFFKEPFSACVEDTLLNSPAAPMMMGITLASMFHICWISI